MLASKKRITMKLKRPNPLFEKWLNEWKIEAKSKKSHTQYAFSNALKSLKKYPLPLESGKDCKILNGFGDKLCMMLDKKLEQHRKTHNLEKTINYQFDIDNINKKNQVSIKKVSQTVVRNDSSLNYSPKFGSEPFAILISLLEESNKNTNGLTKSDLIKECEVYCTDQIKCTTSMKDLLQKELVKKQGKPIKYMLTESGKNLAENLFKQYESEINNLNNLPRKENALIKQNENYNNFETYIFAPNTFDVLLLVDNKETSGSINITTDEVTNGLQQLKVNFEVRHLKVGDYAWICRERTSRKELILPYILERKRVDDFGKSIKDGRFHEQKFRLKQSGIQNLIYLIENYDTTHIGLPITTLYQAATNTLIQDGFSVKFTNSLRGTLEYLACLSTLLSNTFLEKTLVSCSKDNLATTTIFDDLVPLMEFSEFNKNAAKSKPITVSDMFIKQLLQIKGLSIDKALAIVEKYPTPKLLKTLLDNCDENGDKVIANIKYGPLKKNVGPVIGKIIYQLYTKGDF